MNLTYIPTPELVPGSYNSNSVANAGAQAASDLTYETAPGNVSAPGSNLNPLTSGEVNAARTANGVAARTGNENRIIAETGLTDPDTGRPIERYTYVDGVTGDTINVTGRISTINPATGARSTPTGEAVLSVDTYEHNPATPGNPLETRVVNDPLDIRPELSRTTDYNASGAVTGTAATYDDFTRWQQQHDFQDSHLKSFNEEAINALTQQVERAAFHGGATSDATPWLLSYETQFGAGYDFSAGNFDIDTNGAFSATAPNVSVENASGGFDSSWFDWSSAGFGSSNWSGGWVASIFDGWNFSWFEPIVLDLNNDGVDVTSRVDSTVYFDVDGDGFKEQTAWAGPLDGLLVIDLAASGLAGPDGVINQAREVSFALQTAADDTDIQALRTLYDNNSDGKLTAADARFADFKVWRDANQDGVSQASELQTLAAARRRRKQPCRSSQAVPFGRHGRRLLDHAYGLIPEPARLRTGWPAAPIRLAGYSALG